MEQGFRASMNWLHTWPASCWAGCCSRSSGWARSSVFDREIDRWMAPMIRLAGGGEAVLARGAAPAVRRRRRPRSRRPSASRLPTDRDAAIQGLVAGPVGPRAIAFVDPQHRRGAARPRDARRHALHLSVSLHAAYPLPRTSATGWSDWPAMAMMALCVSGVIIHRKIFTDFFTFRPDRKPRRLILDLHNVTGVLGLAVPFPDQPVGAGHLLVDLFPAALAGHLQRRPAGVLRRQLTATSSPRPVGASPAAWPRSTPWPPSARRLLGRLGAALRLRPQSR